jgi:hypothetical protein
MDLDEYGGLQSVISTIHPTTNIGTRLRYCGHDFLDIQDRVFYTSPHKKAVLINSSKIK